MLLLLQLQLVALLLLLLPLLPSSISLLRSGLRLRLFDKAAICLEYCAATAPRTDVVDEIDEAVPPGSHSLSHSLTRSHAQFSIAHNPPLGFCHCPC